MHDPASPGTDFFRCDFCRKPWAEDRPMVEGHRGSLICGQCLSVAYSSMPAANTPSPASQSAADATRPCALCLENRRGWCWESPLFDGVFACERCVRQSASVLAADPDSGWSKPA